jgi:transposase
MCKEIHKCGIDVSSEKLDVRYSCDGRRFGPRVFPNDASGHSLLIDWITVCGQAKARVVLEATGTYHLSLALSLDKAKNTEVMIANPRATHNFAEARMQRGKTDASDTDCLTHFAEEMPFLSWQAPSLKELELQAIGRRIYQLGAEIVAEKSRLSARNALIELGKTVITHRKPHCSARRMGG